MLLFIFDCIFGLFIKDFKLNQLRLASSKCSINDGIAAKISKTDCIVNKKVIAITAVICPSFIKEINKLKAKTINKPNKISQDNSTLLFKMKCSLR